MILTSLAPMAGYTDAAFRAICTRFGASYTVSEMISAMAMVMNDRKTAELARIAPSDGPVVLQLFGHDPEILAKAADLLLSGSFRGCDYDHAPAGVDLNMGCPVRKIVSGGDGSALMRNPELAGRIVAAVKEVCVRYGVPLSVKFRAGWDASSINAPSFACTLAEHGADRLCIHCRTREQMYAPSADPTIAGQVVDALREHGFSTPLVGNGDVDSPEAAAIYRDLGCAEVSIGRAALGDPWLFARIRDPEGFTKPTIVEIKTLVKEFVSTVVEEKGEIRGIAESRGRAACFIKGMRGSARIRDALNHAVTPDEFLSVLDTLDAAADECAAEETT